MNFNVSDWLARRKRNKKLESYPHTLDEMTDHLLSKMSEESKAEYAKEPEEHPGSKYHFFGGMAMRNEFGLWEKTSPMATWFRERGIWHADDMSAIIYKALWCKVTNNPFDIKKEAVYYSEYWKNKYGQGFDGEPITEQPQ